jgi:Metallo-beta-lactamase superfamily
VIARDALAPRPPVIELVTTDGVFRLDGGEWDVTNNIWLVGDEREVIVVDAAHDATPIVEAIGGRRVAAIALTHGHNDHINAAVALQDAVDAPVLLHPDDLMLWHEVYPDRDPDLDLHDGGTLRGGGTELGVLHSWPFPGRLLLRPRAGRSPVQRRHALLRRAGCDRPQLQRLPDDRPIDPRPPADPAARNHRAHRPRREHHDRSRGT